jgi:predicted DNA-binding protein (MmcQ/YjbR family)
LPHLFDTQLKLWSLITNPAMLDSLDNIEAEVLSWPGTNTTLHKYGGMQFNYNGHEIGHVHSNGILDIRFSRKTKQQLMDEGRVNDHHVFDKSGWISFYIRGKEDADNAVELLRMAYLKTRQTYEVLKTS